MTVTDFRKRRTAINATFNDTVSRAKRYEGSAAHEEIMRTATAERDGELEALRRETWSKVQQIIADMRTTAASKPMIAPTAAQEAVLRTLQMRNKLTVDELRQAENTLAGCPIALAVLDDLAKQHGIIKTVMREEMSSADITKYIDGLQANAQKLLRGDNARLNRERADMLELLSEYGGFGYRISENSLGGQSAEINREKIAEFCKIIDAREVQNGE